MNFDHKAAHCFWLKFLEYLLHSIHVTSFHRMKDSTEDLEKESKYFS